MSIYSFKAIKRGGEEFDLAELKGKVLLIVNTATGCGFTPQYKSLEDLYEKYNEKGFEILDFPCNQFANQAPGDDDEIHEFCTLKYDTKFDQFAKVDVNGENESPIFAFLKIQAPEDRVTGLKNKAIMKGIAKISSSTQKAGDIKWNFTKFLVGRDGNVVSRYSPTYKPEDIEKDILAIL